MRDGCPPVLSEVCLEGSFNKIISLHWFKRLNIFMGSVVSVSERCQQLSVDCTLPEVFTDSYRWSNLDGSITSNPML